MARRLLVRVMRSAARPSSIYPGFLREMNLVFQLGARTQRDADELRRFSAAMAADAFGEVTGRRDRRAAHLTYQAISFLGRVVLGRPIDRQHQFMSLLP